MQLQQTKPEQLLSVVFFHLLAGSPTRQLGTTTAGRAAAGSTYLTEVRSENSHGVTWAPKKVG